MAFVLIINTPLSLRFLIKPFHFVRGCSLKCDGRAVTVAAKFLPPLLLSFLLSFPALPLSPGDAARPSWERGVGV